MINAKTKICCLIGNPVAHSLSPQMHNAAYDALGLNYAYLAFRVSDLKDVMHGLKNMGVEGISVTIPHKKAVMEYLDGVDKAGERIGAVNTIYNKNGKLVGTNTDYLGALRALEEKTSLKARKVALLGAGGASRAIAYALKQRGAKVRVFNRTKLNAQKLADEFQLESGHRLDEASLVSEAEIIINTTPVGMFPETDASPIPEECLNSGQTVFDIIFSPKETKLLQYAQRKGAEVIYGHKMLLYQAVLQFELFTGKAAPVRVMEKALKDNLLTLL